MIVENLVSFFFGVGMTFFFQWLLGSNREFFKIIDEFRKKLPPKHKKAEVSFNEKIGFQHMNLNKLDSNINRTDLDYLLKQLEDFDYESVHFKRKQIESYSNNIKRLIKSTNGEKFSIAILQELFEGENHTKSKPYLLGSKIAKYLKF